MANRAESGDRVPACGHMARTELEFRRLGIVAWPVSVTRTRSIRADDAGSGWAPVPHLRIIRRRYRLGILPRGKLGPGSHHYPQLVRHRREEGPRHSTGDPCVNTHVGLDPARVRDVGAHLAADESRMVSRGWRRRRPRCDPVWG